MTSLNFLTITIRLFVGLINLLLVSSFNPYATTTCATFDASSSGSDFKTTCDGKICGGDCFSEIVGFKCFDEQKVLTSSQNCTTALTIIKNGYRCKNKHGTFDCQTKKGPDAECVNCVET